MVPLGREVATLVAYRRPGQRGVAHHAYVPGDVIDPEAARTDLEEIVGEVGDVVILWTVQRTAVSVCPPMRTPETATAAQPSAEQEIATEPEPEPVVDHPRRWEVLSPPFEVPPADGLPLPPLAQPRVVRLAACPLAAGNLAAAVDEPSSVVAPMPRPALPANANDHHAPWTDDRWWSSGFLRCRTAEERLSHLRRWVEAAGGTLVVVEGVVRAELPLLEPCLGRVELLRFCRQLQVSVREARR